MKKITFISDQFFPRTSADSEQIISSLSALGKLFDVTLVSAKYHFKEQVSKNALEDYYNQEVSFKLRFIPHFIKNIRGIEKISFAIRAVRVAKKLNAETVYTRNIPVVISVLLFSKLPIIFESYRPWPSRNIMSKWFFKKLTNLNRFIGIVLHSNFAAKSFKKVGFSDKKLLIAHNAVNIDVYDVESSEETRKKFKLPLDKMIVTYSGRVSVSKGLMRIFDLAKVFTDLLFLIVGSEETGVIEKKAREFSNIKIIKWQDKKTVFNLLKASDILYIPNSLQAREKAQNTVLPLKTFLYKASGVPIIAPDIEDVAEVLTHLETAFLVEVDNLEKEIGGFERLTRDKELRQQIGENAMKEMEESTWDKRAENIQSFIINRLKDSEE